MAHIMTKHEARRAQRQWVKNNPSNRRLTPEQRTLAWIRTYHPQAIDHIVVSPIGYRSAWGRESPKDRSVQEFARSLYPQGGVLKRVPNAHYEACYVVLPPAAVS